MLKHNLKKGIAAPMILGIAVLVIVAGGAFYYFTQDSEMMVDTMEKDTGAMMDSKDEGVMQDDAMDKKDEPMMKDENGGMMMSKGSYQAYNSEKLSLASKEKVILFFHAPWCPICRAIESEINANPAAISDGVHILKVDFDTATQLRQKYGVTIQHTFVQVDAGGNAVAKWSDTSTLAQALERVK